MLEKVNNITTSEDAAKLVQEFEQIIKKKKSDIIWLTYHQEQISHKFKEKERFVSMVSQFGVSKSTIVFNIALFKLINNYPKITNSSLSLHYFKRYLERLEKFAKKTLVILNE